MESPRLQFGIRTLLEITFVAAVVLAFLYLRSASGPNPASDRYQLHIDPKNFDSQILFDTQTGDTWRRYSPDGPWFQVEPPLRKEKEKAS